MEVRLRSAGDTESRLLAEIPFRPEVLDTVISTLGGWGVVDSNGRMWDGEALSGQFVDDGTKAYFEVVIDDGDQ